MGEPTLETDLPRRLRPLDRPGWGWLLAALVLFLALRIPPLTRSLWFDETFSMAAAEKSPEELLAWLPANDTHPAGYYLTLGAWLGLVPGDLGARLLSLLANALHVVVLALTAWRCWGRRAAVGVAFLAAASPALVWPGYEVRSFALAALLVATAWWLAVTCLASGARVRWLLVGLSAAAALHVFYYSAVGLVALGVFVLAARPRPRDLVGLGAAALVAALLLLPWLPVLAHQRDFVAGRTAAGVTALRWNADWLAHVWVHGHLVRLGPWNLWHVLLPLVALAFLLRRRVWAERGPEEARPWLRATGLAVVAFFLGVLAMGAAGSFVRVSYATVLAGLWCLLTVGVAERMRPRARLTLMLVLLAAATTRSVVAGLRAERTDWRGAAAVLRRHAAADHVVLAVPLWEATAYRYYARGAPGTTLTLPQEAPPIPAESEVRRRAWLGHALEGYGAAWLIGTGVRAGDDVARWRARLTALGWRRTSESPVRGIGLERWEPPR